MTLKRAIVLMLAFMLVPGFALAQQNQATFQVNKDFSDNNPAQVSVTISCNTGLPLEQTHLIDEWHNVTFVVGDFSGGDLDCDIYEDPVPAGYDDSYWAGTIDAEADNVDDDSDGCHFEGVYGGLFVCNVTNELQSVEVKVHKQWYDENPQYHGSTFARATAHCYNLADSGYVKEDLTFNGTYDSESFWVYPDYDGSSYCYVEEKVHDSGVESDDSDCSWLSIAPGQGAECTITNTRLYEGIPTLSQYGLGILALAMLGMGLVGFRRFS